MTRDELLHEAIRFRKAIENAKANNEFVATSHYKPERMKNFPHDCCDDAADLFTHYLYHRFGIDSVRVDGQYYNSELMCTRGHSWQETDGWLIDLTGDQFKDDASLLVKADSVYVGKKDAFHSQFEIKRQERSCGIECIADSSWERMYCLYDAIMHHMN